MSVKERARVFDPQSISSLAPKSTLLQRSEKGSPSDYSSLHILKHSMWGQSALALQNWAGEGAVELEDISLSLPRRTPSPSTQEDGNLIILHADKRSES